MAYNPYKWYSNGRPKKRLKESEPLLLRILNGDFNLSHYLNEIPRVEREYDEKYQEEWDKHPGLNDFTRHNYSHRNARMRNVARLKLLEEGMWDEIRILENLRQALEKEFGVDLWDEAHEEQRGDGSVKDLYFWYKKKTGIGQTKSEIEMLKKKSKSLKRQS